MSEKLHVVCIYCDAINRLPADKLSAGGNCGVCHKPLFPGEVVELNGPRFEKHTSKSQIPLLVDFWAPWCGPCKMMAPIFVQAAKEIEPLCRFAKVNTEKEQALAARFAIRSIPTLILFKPNGDTPRMSGALDKQNLLAWVRQNL